MSEGAAGVLAGDGGLSGRSGGSRRSTRRTATCSTKPARARPKESSPSPTTRTPAGAVSGRAWSAPAGSSLLVSVLLRPALGPDRLMLVTMAAGLALAEAVEQVAGFPVSIKWPNDLMVDPPRRPQARRTAGRGRSRQPGTSGIAVVVGAGCNVQWDAFPPELAAFGDRVQPRGGPAASTATRCSTRTSPRLAARYSALDGVGHRATGPGSGPWAAASGSSSRRRILTAGARSSGGRRASTARAG